jgi:hypothetical protein
MVAGSALGVPPEALAKGGCYGYMDVMHYVYLIQSELNARQH